MVPVSRLLETWRIIVCHEALLSRPSGVLSLPYQQLRAWWAVWSVPPRAQVHVLLSPPPPSDCERSWVVELGPGPWLVPVPQHHADSNRWRHTWAVEHWAYLPSYAALRPPNRVRSHSIVGTHGLSYLLVMSFYFEYEFTFIALILIILFNFWDEIQVKWKKNSCGIFYTVFLKLY